MNDVRTLVGHLAQALGHAVLLEDASQQPVAHSAHDTVSDTMREASILRQATGQDVVDWFAAFNLRERIDPFVIDADSDAGMLARLCIPLRHGSTPLGYAWALLPDGTVDLPLAAPVGEAVEHLRLAMVAQRQARVRESTTLLGLLSADPEERAESAVGLHRFLHGASGLRVLVCTGPVFRNAAAGAAFWTAGWSTDVTRMLRAAEDSEGIVLVPADRPDAITDRAFGAHKQVARACGTPPGTPMPGLVVGISDTVPDLTDAPTAHHRARMAARVALADPRHAPAATWDDLGVYRLLSQLPDRQLRDAVDPRLGRLVADRPVVAATLEVYLDLAGAVSQTADTLHIHRTTLYARLEQAAAGGLDMTVGHDRLSAHTSLKALRLIGEGSPTIV